MNQAEYLPFHSTKVQAGFPSPADDYIESYLDLNEYLIQHPASTFFLIAAGEAMRDAGIQPGDLLIVDKSIEASHNKLVIAALNGELTIKRLSKAGGKIQLHPAQKNLKKECSLDIETTQDCIIWGVITHIIHKAI